MYRLWRQWDVEVISALLCLLAGLMLWSASGCDSVKSAGATAGGTVAEWIACPTDLIDCGHVYVCGDAELCINDDDAPEDVDSAEAMFGACEPTQRHQGLCIWCPSGAGCNAFQGCWGCP